MQVVVVSHNHAVEASLVAMAIARLDSHRCADVLASALLAEPVEEMRGESSELGVCGGLPELRSSAGTCEDVCVVLKVSVWRQWTRCGKTSKLFVLLCAALLAQRLPPSTQHLRNQKTDGHALVPGRGVAAYSTRR